MAVRQFPEFDRTLAEGRRAIRRTVKEIRRLYRRLGRAEKHLREHPPKLDLDRPVPELRAWALMLKRCYDPKVQGYTDHGARGIKVCDRWRTSWVRFLVDVGLHRPGFVLARIDPNKDFSPSNARWLSTSQLWNRRRPRNSRLIIFNGVLWSLPGLAKELGLSYNSLYASIVRRGLTVEEGIQRAIHRDEAICKCGESKPRPNPADVGTKGLDHA